MDGALKNTIEIINCHAKGEVGDVIVAGVEPPPGETIWEQAQWIASDQALLETGIIKMKAYPG